MVFQTFSSAVFSHVSLSKAEGTWPAITICERQGLSRSHIQRIVTLLNGWYPGRFFVDKIINCIKSIITDGIQALSLRCWRWQETSVLPHLELFAEPGKVFSCRSAWCLRPGTNLIVHLHNATCKDPSAWPPGRLYLVYLKQIHPLPFKNFQCNLNSLGLKLMCQTSSRNWSRPFDLVSSAYHHHLYLQAMFSLLSLCLSLRKS